MALSLSLSHSEKKITKQGYSLFLPQNHYCKMRFVSMGRREPPYTTLYQNEIWSWSTSPTQDHYTRWKERGVAVTNRREVCTSWLHQSETELFGYTKVRQKFCFCFCVCVWGGGGGGGKAPMQITTGEPRPFLTWQAEGRGEQVTRTRQSTPTES